MVRSADAAASASRVAASRPCPGGPSPCAGAALPSAISPAMAAIAASGSSWSVGLANDVLNRAPPSRSDRVNRSSWSTAVPNAWRSCQLSWSGPGRASCSHALTCACRLRSSAGPGGEGDRPRQGDDGGCLRSPARRGLRPGAGSSRIRAVLAGRPPRPPTPARAGRSRTGKPGRRDPAQDRGHRPAAPCTSTVSPRATSPSGAAAGRRSRTSARGSPPAPGRAHRGPRRLRLRSRRPARRRRRTRSARPPDSCSQPRAARSEFLDDADELVAGRERRLGHAADRCRRAAEHR